MKKLRSPEQLAALQKRLALSHDDGKPVIIVCGGTSCRSNGSLKLFELMSTELEKRDLTGRIRIKMSGCHGFCQEGPVVVIEPEGIFYRKVGLENMEQDTIDIIEHLALGGKPVERLLYENPDSGEKIAHCSDIPFYAGQTRIALKNNGKIDPANIEDAIAAGGYSALAKALTMKPEAVIDIIKRSGLRGRGGGGFPTGRKWAFCRNAAERSMRYIICNADEGDPGAFMDRSIMEGDAHSVIEGMTVGAYAMSMGICPAEGYVYIRAEYPLAVSNVRKAIKDAKALGLLGEDILGSGFSFNIKVKEGAGAFVCGEETALIASIEGKRGMPKPRPPFPANAGLFGKPSNINNVETWVNIPRIINGGAEWYAGVGTESSPGTKVFSLVGKVKNSGLVEVPMGIPIHKIIFDIGGGIPGGKRIKAVQTGGPSGGCIPADKLDISVDYEKLIEAGSIMGSGGLVVMDEDTCMVDIARYFVNFTREESCGKCSPCRLGTKQLLDILTRISSGKGKIEDIKLLQDIGMAMKKGSLCGLGQTAANPVLSTLRYFLQEYESHIMEHKCASAVCPGLVKAPCEHTCPAHINIPRYLRCIADKKYSEALDVIREKIPFPSVCGYVCFHPCEAKCRRGQIDEPLAIRALKRFVAEHGEKTVEHQTDIAPTGKRVAVLGGGPAGLTAAYYLARKGHSITLFDKNKQLGGTLLSGIPAFRLPREIIRKEIDTILKTPGIIAKTNHAVSAVSEFAQNNDFDAILLAYGARKGIKMNIQGVDDKNVLDCLSFLEQVNAGKTIDIGRHVIVVGGGSSAMDAARCAVRMSNVETVTVVYRRTLQDMPAADEEIQEAIEENIRLEFLTNPVKIERIGESLSITCAKMQKGAIDSSGRHRPVPTKGNETFKLHADSVIMAIGQIPDDISDNAFETDKNNRVKVIDSSLATSAKGIFAAGDVVTGPASIIEAIAAGRRAAESIDKYLGGNGDITEILTENELIPAQIVLEEGERPRVKIPTRAAAERVRDSEEVEICYPEDAAISEARRCLQCDLEDV